MMECLCPQCRALLENQSISLHSGLTETNHVHNHTLYQCVDCEAEIALVSVPHRWELVSRARQEKVA